MRVAELLLRFVLELSVLQLLLVLLVVDLLIVSVTRTFDVVLVRRLSGRSCFVHESDSTNLYLSLSLSVDITAQRV